MKKLTIVLAAICGILLIPFLCAAEDPAPVVRVGAGELRGQAAGSLMIFKGIPFAAPPVGHLRWRAPQPVQPWKGTRSATEFGQECMQAPASFSSNPLRASLSEDCLYLNVWAPRNRRASPLPVMVWIHGGGFVNGGSSPAAFDGSHFAEQGIVFVSINYRLGRFGFFAFPALLHEGGRIGNYALMDQIAALNWVKRNIGAFRGDPRQVTIFGESAGGESVNLLLDSPQSRGLFVRALIESGGGRDNLMKARPLKDAGPQGEPSAAQVGVNFARSVGIDEMDAKALAALRGLPAERIVNGLSMGSMEQQITVYSGPIVDGTLVARTTESAYRDCRRERVAVIVGANDADLGAAKGNSLDDILARFGGDADAARRAFGIKPGDTLAAVRNRIGGVEMMVEPARFAARSIAACGSPVYEFRFSHVAEPLRAKFSGAPHSSEIPYVFSTLSESTWGNLGKGLAQPDLDVERQMHAYWVNFVKTGNPNGPGLPVWPQYSTSEDRLMDFTAAGAASEIDSWRERLDLVEKLH
jgi:para-nitrobenzyl esterase